MGRGSQLTLTLTLTLALTSHRARANPAHLAPFQLLGPAPIDPTAHGHSNAGAVQAIAVDPTDKNTVYVGSVNGGVWRTTDFHPGEPGHAPSWKPLTDTMPSLSITGLSIDPTVTSGQTVVASLGAQSSARGYHGALVGVLRTIDGGAHWQSLGAADLAGQDLTDVAARGLYLVVASKNPSGGGVFQSHDGGTSFQRISGTTKPDGTPNLLEGPVTSMVGDPKHDNRLWIGVTGANGGVYQSEDYGGSWTKVSPAALDADASASLARKVLLDVQTYPHGEHEVYAAIADDKSEDTAGSGSEITAIFRLTQTGGGPTTADDMEQSVLPAFETADQGKVAIAADPLHEDTFFVAGDEGLVFRCVQAVGGTGTPSCTAISGAGHTSGNTAPHPDARKLVFDTDTALLATDDGGVFLRSSPRKNTGDWVSKNGDLAITETYCAYDSHTHLAFCGTQDNGTVGQAQAGALVWPQLLSADGGIPTVSDELFACPWNHNRKCSAQYFSHQDLESFTNQDCDDTDHCKVESSAHMLLLGSSTIACKSSSTAMGCDQGLSIRTPIAADRYDAKRLAMVGTQLYESSDSGKTVKVVHGFAGKPEAILFGGKRNGAENADLLLVGSSTALFARTAPGAVAATTYDVTNGAPKAIAVDREDWSTVWLTTSRGTVWEGTDVTGTHEAWTNVTGDLAPGGPSATDLRAIVHVGGDDPYVAVGGDDGMYAARTSDLAHWFKLTGALPDVVIATIDYAKGDDLLVIGTVGRSAWSIGSARKLFAPLILHTDGPAHGPHVPPAGPGHVNPGDPVEDTHEVTPTARHRKRPR